VAAANAGVGGGTGVAELSRRQAYMERSMCVDGLPYPLTCLTALPPDLRLGDGLPDRPFFRHVLVGASHGR
jgi:hypothetical protein